MGMDRPSAALNASTNGTVTPARPTSNSSAMVGAATAKAVRASSSTAFRPNRTNSARAGPSPVSSSIHRTG
jgi:hypothetical protein